MSNQRGKRKNSKVNYVSAGDRRFSIFSPSKYYL